MNRRRPSFPSLKAYRDAYHLSQRAAAAEVGITQAQWCRVETGLRCPSPALALKLHEHTGVPLEVLLASARAAA